MAQVLYISEYVDQPFLNGHPTNVVREPALVEQTPITFTTSTQSAAFNAATHLIRVHNDAGGACSILVGANPTATTSCKRLAANQTEYFKVESGNKLAVITNS